MTRNGRSGTTVTWNRRHVAQRLSREALAFLAELLDCRDAAHDFWHYAQLTGGGVFEIQNPPLPPVDELLRAHEGPHVFMGIRFGSQKFMSLLGVENVVAV